MGTSVMGVEKVPVGGWEGRLLAVTWCLLVGGKSGYMKLQSQYLI